MPPHYTRREFLKIAAQGAALLAVSPLLSAGTNTPDLYVLEGTDYKKLIREAFNCLGGVKRFVKPNDYVVIKPNASWSRPPEQAANTHPDLVGEAVRLCLEAGAGKVDVIDYTCDNYKSAFKINGIAEAVKKAGGNMIALNEAGSFTEVNIEKARILKSAGIADQVLKADCFINMPIAKDHGAAKLTLSMKNYMGIVKDRWAFHTKGLHQCIADVSSFLKPDIIILDATRILTSRGPKGPGSVKVLNKIIAGTDPVSVDSLGAGFFGVKPHDIGYIKLAAEMAIGRSDIENLNVLQKVC